MDVNRMIAMKIIQAQAASDYGKRDRRLSLNYELDKGPARYKYRIKERYILDAIRLIRSNKTDFKYAIEEKEDQNGYPSIIVYFETWVCGMKLQISFHTPLGRASEELCSYIGSGRRAKWDKDLGGSLRACKELMSLYEIKLGKDGGHPSEKNRPYRSAAERRYLSAWVKWNL